MYKLYNVVIFSIPKTILQCTTVICDYMSAYHEYYVTCCLLITMFMLSFIQMQGVDCHLFHHEKSKVTISF